MKRKNQIDVRIEFLDHEIILTQPFSDMNPADGNTYRTFFGVTFAILKNGKLRGTGQALVGGTFNMETREVFSGEGNIEAVQLTAENALTLKEKRPRAATESIEEQIRQHLEIWEDEDGGDK